MRIADSTPTGMATASQMMAATVTSDSVTGKASLIALSTLCNRENEFPSRPT